MSGLSARFVLVTILLVVVSVSLNYFFSLTSFAVLDSSSFFTAKTLPDGTVSVYDRVGYGQRLIAVFQPGVSQQSSSRSVSFFPRTPPSSSLPPVPKSLPFHLALVVDYGSREISVIDTRTNTEIKRVSVASTLGPPPKFVAMRGDGQYAYITSRTSSYGGQQTILKFDMNTLSVVSTITFTPSSSKYYSVEDFELSPDDRWLLLADIYRSTLYIFDTTTDTLVQTLTFCTSCSPGFNIPGPITLAFSPDGKSAYVGWGPASSGIHEHTLDVVDLSTQTIVRMASFTDATPPVSLVVSEDNQHLYANYAYCNPRCFIREFSLPSLNRVRDILLPSQPYMPFWDLKLVSGDTRLVTSDIAAGNPPERLEVVDLASGGTVPMPSSETGRYFVYNKAREELWSVCLDILSYSITCNEGRIDVFDATTLTHLLAIDPPTRMSEIGLPALSQDGRYYYMPSDNLYVGDNLIVIDAATHAYVKDIPVGALPVGVYMQGDNSIKPRLIG